MPDVFISYSRKDSKFVGVLKEALEDSTYETWIDWDDIPKSADWWQEIERGIEASDAFIFVISPDSIESQVCRQEVNHAVQRKKRLIPIVYRENFNFDLVHPALSRHNWLFFREEDDFDVAFETLVDTINTDLEHAREHTRFLLRALEWERASRDQSFLLTGKALQMAEQWLENGAEKPPYPTELHLEYIRLSQEHWKQSKIQEKRTQIIEDDYAKVVDKLQNALVYNQLRLRTILRSSLVISVVVLLLRLAFLQSPELAAYDTFMRLRPGESTDPSVLVIGIEGDDIDAQRGRNETFGATLSLSDQSLSQLLTRLQQAQPRLIGLDMYMHPNLENVNPQLAEQISGYDNFLTVCKVPDTGANGVSIANGIKAPSIVPPERVGFSDFLDESDTVVRRQLLLMDVSGIEGDVTCPLAASDPAKESLKESFSFLLAQHYIEHELGGEMAYQNPLSSGASTLTIGGVDFPRVNALTGGYQGIYSGGYQVMLNYRTSREGNLQSVFEQYSLEDVLNGIVPEEAIRDRIVLIGVVDAANPDHWATPFGVSDQQVAGVVMHAQMTSQMISAVLNNRQLIWSWSEPVEIAWIVLWAMIGGFLTWRCRKVTKLALMVAIALISLWVICFVGFLRMACWMPVVPASLALVLTTGSILYLAYRPQPSASVELTRQKEDELISVP